MMKIRFEIIVGVVLFFAAVNGAFAFSQFPVDANPAEYFNPRAVFTNPGIILDQRYQIHGGVRLFHLGFEPGDADAFRQTMLNFVQPYSIAPRWGYAINVTSLSIPSITQNEISLAVAHKITDVFSLGVSGSFLTQSITEYDWNDVEVPGDPALHAPLQLDMTYGAGLFVGPVNNFSFGLGVQYLNEPDISMMGDNFPLKVKFDVGLCYTFTSFTPSFSLNYSNNQTFYRFGVYGRRESVGRIGLFYGTDQISIEAELEMFDSRIALGYRYDYEINEIHSVSSGSHQLGFTYRLPEPDRIVFQLASDLNRMTLYEEHLTIDIDSAVTRKDLVRLKEYNLNFFDENYPLAIVWEEAADSLRFTASALSELDSLRYHTYCHTLASLASGGISDKLQLRILCPENSFDRAAALQSFAIDTLGLLPEQTKLLFVEYPEKKAEKSKNLLDIIYQNRQRMRKKRFKLYLPGKVYASNDQVNFYLDQMLYSRKVRGWRLIVESDGKVIRKFSGSQKPDVINWDFCDELGHLVGPGEYEYYFQWKQGIYDSWHPQNPKKDVVSVIRVSRGEYVHLTKDSQLPKFTDKLSPGKVEFMLKHYEDFDPPMPETPIPENSEITADSKRQPVDASTYNHHPLSEPED